MKTFQKVIVGGTAAGIIAALIWKKFGIQKPKQAQPVMDFDIEKYLGKWYEIARLDFRHERNLNNTTATYSMNEDGSIHVLNEGYNTKDRAWTHSEGRAIFRGDETVGALSVSFFGPFYTGYNIICIDEDYQYALIAGKSLDYLWLLSRTKDIPEEVKNRFLIQAEFIGYDTDELLWVHHD